MDLSAQGLLNLMWCKHCQQDVPAIASPEDQVTRCAKCQNRLGASAVETDPASEATSESAEDWLEDPLLDDWEFEEDLKETQRLAESLGVRVERNSVTRIDGPHVHAAEELPARSANEPRKGAREEESAHSSFFSWCMLSVGLMAFVFGSVLLGWSFAADRVDLWRLGMPFTLGGQAALVVGLVFQLDGLWRSNRQAKETLAELDSQLDELRHTTSLLSTTRSSPSQSFYLHLAEGASPKLLLADLKGQLDLLANRLAEDR